MRFTARIDTPDGGRRDVAFDCAYDARAVLKAHVEKEILRPGEAVHMGPPPNDGQDRRKEPVPAIERIA